MKMHSKTLEYNSDMDKQTTIKQFFGNKLNIEFFDDEGKPEIYIDDGMVALVVKGEGLTSKIKDKYKTYIGKVSFVKGPPVCQNPNAWNALEDETKNFFKDLDTTIE